MPVPQNVSREQEIRLFCVDDFTWKESNGVEDLRGIINEDIAPQGTDSGGEFDDQLNPFLSERGIKRENTPPHTPQYNGVAEGALGILRDKAVALLRRVTEGESNCL